MTKRALSHLTDNGYTLPGARYKLRAVQGQSGLLVGQEEILPDIVSVDRIRAIVPLFMSSQCRTLGRVVFLNKTTFTF